MPVLDNPKWELFCQERAKGKTEKEAYELAGFSPDEGNASRLAARTEIIARYQELIGAVAQDAIQRTGIDKAWVLNRLVENVERAMTIEAVRDSEGRETGEYRYEGNVANRALELIGKELHMFVDRKETGKPGEFKKLEEMNAAELREFIGNRTKADSLRVQSPSNGGGAGGAGGQSKAVHKSSVA